MKETSLGPPVVAWLHEQGFDVFQEVATGGATPDLVGRCGAHVIIVELKVRLGLDVIAQAKNWVGAASWIYVATPRTHGDGYRLGVHVAHGLGIGTLSVDTCRVDLAGTRVERVAPYHRRFDERRVAGRLCDEMRVTSSNLEAGSQAASRYTPFRRSCDVIARDARQNPGSTITELFKRVGALHWASLASAKSSLPKLLERGVVHGVRGEKDDGGRLRIYPAEERRTA